MAQFIPRDLILIEVEAVEDGLVEQPLLVVVATTVERLRVLEQGQTEVDQTRIIGQIGDFLAQPLSEMGALAFEAAELLLDLGLRHAAVRSHVQQVVLLRIESLNLGLELLLEQASSPLVVRQSGGHMGSGLLDELWAESHGPIDALHGILDAHCVDVRHGAFVGALVHAEEVLVGGAARVGGVLDDEPLLHLASVATAAVDRPLELVMVGASPLASH